MTAWLLLALWMIGAAVFVIPAPAGAQGQDPFAAMRVAKPPAPTPSPEFAFRTMAGDEVRVSSFRGKAVLLGFFSTT